MKKTATVSVFGVLVSLLTFCTSCQYLPDALKEIGGLKVKESFELDFESPENPKEFPEHCNKDDVEAKKL